MSDVKDTTYTLPVGPVHVALEEPMYFKLDVDGEIVRGVELTAGHVHRGMEALALRRTLFQNIVLTERVCSLCSNSHPYTYCMAVENLASIAVPERALYLRVMAEEIKRVASHLFNVAVLAHIIGFKSLFMHVMEVREIMQDVKETVYGNRMDLAANCIGGVKYDVDAELTRFLVESLAKVEREVRSIMNIYATDAMILRRSRGVGVLGKEDARSFAVVGPVARGSGLPLDVRVEAPYGAYPRLDVEVVTEDGCDVHSRAMVRMREILVSIGLLRRCVKDLPGGPLCAPLPEIPAGESLARSEAPRGELVYYLRTDGTDTPNRLKWRVPSYMNWDALGVMMKDCRISDIPLIVNSIDPCISCTER
ncbi:NADH-ubiquinone oxidoreductase chain 49kDa [Desulfovibrio sp. X2]|uniref:hydrogenase large subunit n=1 Tax=Desulfovibrio sp. X2 TaxID=941449 RepID=UPI000358EF90|nr:nickel-dependent hydrogenase large subunit [Desulfovibrio sp. X2]EPR37392.1 NADH-ubiquinone oxidoreductase chain 49kDa [Desulfovibrio sp. X2]